MTEISAQSQDRFQSTLTAFQLADKQGGYEDGLLSKDEATAMGFLFEGVGEDNLMSFEEAGKAAGQYSDQQLVDIVKNAAAAVNPSKTEDGGSVNPSSKGGSFYSQLSPDSQEKIRKQAEEGIDKLFPGLSPQEREQQVQQALTMMV